jgi:hypothetical protein
VGLYAAALAERYGLVHRAIDTSMSTDPGAPNVPARGLLYVHEGKRAVASWWRTWDRGGWRKRIDEARNIDAQKPDLVRRRVARGGDVAACGIAGFKPGDDVHEY